MENIMMLPASYCVMNEEEAGSIMMFSIVALLYEQYPKTARCAPV